MKWLYTLLAETKKNNKREYSVRENETSLFISKTVHAAQASSERNEILDHETRDKIHNLEVST